MNAQTCAVQEKGRIRLRQENTPRPLYVTCPRDWRSQIERGTVLTIVAHVRADGERLVVVPIVH